MFVVVSVASFVVNFVVKSRARGSGHYRTASCHPTPDNPRTRCPVGRLGFSCPRQLECRTAWCCVARCCVVLRGVQGGVENVSVQWLDKSQLEPSHQSSWERVGSWAFAQWPRSPLWLPHLPSALSDSLNWGAPMQAVDLCFLPFHFHDPIHVPSNPPRLPDSGGYSSLHRRNPPDLREQDGRRARGDLAHSHWVRPIL